jgi:hypothetical protein
MKKILFLAVGILGYLSLSAQSESFPLLYSQYGMNGTASYIGKAGAIGALGGDIMSAHYNPAGLGVYRTSEITFTSGIDITSTKSNYNGLKTNDSYPAYNFGNFGMVLDFNNGKNSSFKHIQLSFGIDRLMNFNNREKIMRNDLSTSYINDFVMNEIVNNNDANSDFINSGVVNLDTSTNTISSVFDNNHTGKFNQIKSIKESGYLNEFSMSLSTNYENWLYLGATIGIPFGDYTCISTFTEERFVDGVSTGYYNYNEEQDLSFTGWNFKFGAIVKPVQWLRLGVAIHTPTFFLDDDDNKDDYYSGVAYTRNSGGWWPTYSYGMQTPWRFLGSAAVVLGNNKSKVAGTISMDYEYADYSCMSFKIDDNPTKETTLNNAIENDFQGASTLRFGGELKVDRIAFRAGYANIGNPYVKAQNDRSWDYITCGLGYKGKYCFFDLAYAYGKCSNSSYYFYDNNEAKIKENKHLIEATIGFRF